ncbi:MAG: SPOR domain-containing protein [Arenimonas sp.]|uniref:SPOR domain-containing protein n=1 Tax=Arenimonas sp. TaxID=1872635 RepID=UPI0025C36096|nr:SPOR domain-containing protein [Arenimonas sp.]MBW8366893.1 SPOR domain-containing protein [Arenimonas sp.]
MILRGLVVLLVCLNLGVGAWWLVQPEPSPDPPPPVDAGVGSLVLLGEAETPPTADEMEVGAVPVPMPETPGCLTIGPFATPAELRAAMAALTPSAARIQFREVAATQLRGYRVYLPAAASREAALAAARQLAARGVRDYYVVTAGDQENTVSLGLFRDLANAEKRREEISAQGFAAVLEPRTDAGAQWWIDLAAEPDLDWKSLLPAAKDLQARPITCE